MIFVVTGLVSQDHRQWPPVLGPGLPAPHHSPQLGGGHGCSPGQQQLGDRHAGAQADDEALCDGCRPPDPPACLIHVLRLSPDPGHAAHLPWAHHHWPRTLPVQRHQPWYRPDGWVQGEQWPLSWPWTTSSQEDMEQLVYEEYDTEEHKVLAIVLENESVNVIRECPSSWVTGRWSITGPDSIPQLLLTSHKPGGCPSQELCDGGVCLGWEVDHSLLCKHPLPGQICGQKHWHQAFIALEVNDKL